MSTRRRQAEKVSVPTVQVPNPAGETSAAFDRQKQQFLSRNAAQCPYLLVQLQADLPGRRLTLIASFAFSVDRAWQQVETQIPIAELQADSGPESRLVEAFAHLEDGIGAARIARLFSPLTEAQRIAAGR